MDFYVMSDKAIASEIGARIKALRLRKNMTQAELANATLLSLNSIKSLEAGKGKLSTLISVLRELGALDTFDQFIPDLKISPVELAKRQGKVRMRASSSRKSDKKKQRGDDQW